MKDLTTDLCANRPGQSGGWKSMLLNAAKMCVILAATVLITELLRGYVTLQSLLMIYMVSVLVISYLTPAYSYGIIAALLSTFLFDWLITEPRLAFSFTRGFPITLLTMLLATFLTSTLTIQMKTQARLALDREQRAQLLYEINQKLLAARDADTIIVLTNEYLVGHLQRPVIFYTMDPLGPVEGYYAQDAGNHDGAAVFNDMRERKRVHRIFQSGGILPEDFDDRDHVVYYAPLVSKSKVLGVIGVSCHEKPLSQSNLTLIRMITGQVTLALELQYLSDTQKRTLIDAEREKMRSSLLRAVSHDLRTPLTSILGASATILEQREIDEATAHRLVTDINENAQWLIRMVENLLSVTRISKDTMTVAKMLEAAEEVVAQAVSMVRKRFPDCHIHVRIPDELLMVPMDATLISQVIINILENAVRNSDPGSLIFVDLAKVGDFAQFVITDNGRGIPDQLLGNLFEVHTPNNGQAMDTERGMGIGLSICMAIITAHGGSIEGYNREEGGAKFTFLLPLQEEVSVEA